MNLESNDRAIGLLVLLSFLLVLYFLKSIPTPSRPPGSSSEGDFFIEVSGDVKAPGVYSFNYLPDIINLMDRAGGLNPDMPRPQGSINGPLSNGMLVTVRQKGLNTRFFLSDISAFYKITLGIPISLNTESETGLTAIPGIGPSLAKAIVKERSERGGFQRLSDVLFVKGMGPKLYKRISPFIIL